MTTNPPEDAPPTQLSIAQFTASVKVEGKKVPLYGIEYEENQKTATCWIESEAGKAFGVYWEDSKRTCITSGNAYVDGTFCNGLIIRPMGLIGSPSQNWQYSDYCVRTVNTQQKFEFSKVEVTDDDAYYGQAISEHFGTILLKVWRIQDLGEGNAPVEKKHTVEKVHERSKKAMGHQVRLGAEVHVAPQRFVKVSYDELLATFIFKYRPKEHLQANDIMPRPKKRKVELSEDIIDLTSTITQAPLRKKQKVESHGIIDLTVEDEGKSGPDREIEELRAQIRFLEERKKKRNKTVKKEVEQEA